MKAKGYTYQDETKRRVSLEALQNGLPGTGTSNASAVGTGVLNDVVGLGVAIGAVGGIVNMTKEMLDPIVNDSVSAGSGAASIASAATANKWNCRCGMSCISSNFCPECGTQRPASENVWNCACGRANIASKFCPDCGRKKEG